MAQPDQQTPLENIIKLHLSEDHMQASLYFITKNKIEVSRTDIIDILNAHGIQYGVMNDAINQALERYKNNPEDVFKKDLVVVKGKPVDKGVNGSAEYMIPDSIPVAIDQSGKADFRNIEKFKTVTRGQTLVRITPARKGSDGYNIFGESIAAPEVRDIEVHAGENTEYDQTKHEIRALKDGVYHKDENHVSVSETLLISNNIGLETGNINYEGVIKIEGSIERGAAVKSHDDIFVDGLVESGSINCGGSLHVNGGINTKLQGTIQVKQSVNCSFIENSNLYAEGGISVVSNIIGSNVISCGDIYLLKEGNKIVGGEVHAFAHIEADNIGNANETNTVIHIGKHYRYNKIFEDMNTEFLEVEKTFKELVEEIKEIKEYIQRSGGKISNEKKLEMKKKYEQYKAAESDYTERSKKLEMVKKRVYYQGDPLISVKNVLHRGVVFHFFNHVEKVDTEYKHCTMRFNRAEGKMHLEPYRELKKEPFTE